MLREGTQDNFIRKRVNMPTEKSHAELVSDVASQIKARAFFSARVAEAHILDRLRDVSDRYSRGEMGLGEARNMLKEFLRGQGLDPHQAGMRNLASTGRLNLILRQNAAMARAAGEWKRMHDPDQMTVFPFVRYHSRNDGRTRGSHDALDGKIFDKNDPFLKTHTPPWEFNCRCWLEEITAKEAGDNVEPLTKPEDVRVESESGFVFDPEEGLGTFDLTSIRDDALRKATAEQLESRFEMAVSSDGKYASLPTDTEKIEREPNVVGEKVEKAIQPLKRSKHIQTADFSRTPEGAAENVGKAANRIALRTEEYGLDIPYVGTHYHSRDMEKTELNPRTLFETRERNGRTEFIFNERMLADPELASKMKEAAEAGIHPKSVNTIEAYADHDIAHLLFYKARMDENVVFMKWMKFLYHHPFLTSNLVSKYPMCCTEREDLSEKQKDLLFAQETLAECWASAKNSSTPPKVHKFFAMMLEKRLRKMYGNPN